MITDAQISKMVEKILRMPKYRDVEIPVQTLQSLIDAALPLCKNISELEKRVREKVHNIVALYLGDIDYDKAISDFRQVKGCDLSLKEFSLGILQAHASTKERGQDLATFYQILFDHIGSVKSIADLACGLHPVGLPFMGLPPGTAYHAYDLNRSRVEFLHAFITGQGYSGGCFHRDILTNPLLEEYDVALFLKEAHRFEKRQPGVLPGFLDSIRARKIVVSLPLQSFGMHIQIYPKYEKILCEYTQSHGWPLEKLIVGSEVFFIIQRNNDTTQQPATLRGL